MVFGNWGNLVYIVEMGAYYIGGLLYRRILSVESLIGAVKFD